MEKITLNFFGDEVVIDTPKDIASLRDKISEKYSFSSSEAAEIILYYVNDSKKTYIINGNDFSKFKEVKISTIFLDVNQNSKLYLDNVSKVKEEIKKEEERKTEVKKEEVKKEEKKTEVKKEEEKKEEEVDMEKTKKEIEKIDAEIEEMTKAQNEKNKLYNEKISEITKQIVELEKMRTDLTMEKDLDFYELSDKKGELRKKKEELKKKIEEKKKKEEPILKAAPKPQFRGFRGGPNHFPYNTQALRRNEENRKQYFAKLEIAKQKRMKERKALEEQKSLEAKNELILKDVKLNITGTIPVFGKVNEVLRRTVEKVKILARQKVMTKEEKEIAKKEENIKKEKEKSKKEQIEQIKKITKDAVKEINNLTKLVIEQSNSLIDRINNPQLFKSQSSDDILLRAAPKVEKKPKLEIHYNIICDGCKITPLRGNRYKCKKCKNFDFCEECYEKNKESHGHDFQKIEHPICRNRLGHPNKKYIQRGIIHSKVMCDGCGMLPLSGWRYKCDICDDYNLCENCEERIGGKHNHPFIKITYSSMMSEFDDNYLKLNSYQPNL